MTVSPTAASATPFTALKSVEDFQSPNTRDLAERVDASAIAVKEAWGRYVTLSDADQALKVAFTASFYADAQFTKDETGKRREIESEATKIAFGLYSQRNTAVLGEAHRLLREESEARTAEILARYRGPAPLPAPL